METLATYRKEMSFSDISVMVMMVGEDCQLLLYGGEMEHLGCTVLAVPRPSLRGDGRMSVTSSVLNVVGHMDEQLCRCLAEAVARKYGKTVVCSGGFHVDRITEGQIDEVRDAVRELSARI